MGDICPSCGAALPEDTPCPCTADYYDLANDEEWIRLLLQAEVGPPRVIVNTCGSRSFRLLPAGLPWRPRARVVRRACR